MTLGRQLGQDAKTERDTARVLRQRAQERTCREIARELRAGMTEDGKTRLKAPSGSLSVAEAISVVTKLTLAAHFGDGELSSRDVATSVIGAVVKDPVQDQAVSNEYLETAVKKRAGWKEFYAACREVS